MVIYGKLNCAEEIHMEDVTQWEIKETQSEQQYLNRQ